MNIVQQQYPTFEGFSPGSTLGPYRAQDYWQLPEGAPVELLRGNFVMSPSPHSNHQSMVVLLTKQLLKFEEQGGGVAFVSPMDVVLSDDTILQPDLLYIAKDRRHIVEDRIQGPPDLAIEILSSGTQRRDRIEKLDLYAKFEVPEYWIIDAEARVIEFLLLNHGEYVVQQSLKNRYQSSHLDEVAIDLEEFWQAYEQRLR